MIELCDLLFCLHLLNYPFPAFGVNDVWVSWRTFKKLSGDHYKENKEKGNLQTSVKWNWVVESCQGCASGIVSNLFRLRATLGGRSYKSDTLHFHVKSLQEMSMDESTIVLEVSVD